MLPAAVLKFLGLSASPTDPRVTAAIAALWPTGPAPKTVFPGSWIHRAADPRSPSGRCWLLVSGRAEIWRDEAYLSTRESGVILAMFAGLTEGSVAYDARAIDTVEIVEILHQDLAAILVDTSPLLDPLRYALLAHLRHEAKSQSTRCALAVRRLSVPTWGGGVQAYDVADPARAHLLTPMPMQAVQLLMLPVFVEVRDRIPPGLPRPTAAKLPGWVIVAEGQAPERSITAVVVELPSGGELVPIGIWADRAPDLVALREEFGVNAMFGHAEVEGRPTSPVLTPSVIGATPGPARAAVLRADSEHALVVEFQDTVTGASPPTAGVAYFVSWLRRFEPSVWGSAGASRRWDPSQFLIDALFDVPIELATVTGARPISVVSTTSLTLDGATFDIDPRGVVGWELRAEARVRTPSLRLDYRAGSVPPSQLGWRPSSSVNLYKSAGKMAEPRDRVHRDAGGSVRQAIQNALGTVPGASAAEHVVILDTLEAGATFLPEDTTFHRGHGDIPYAVALTKGFVDETFGDITMPRLRPPLLVVGTQAILPVVFIAPAAVALRRRRTFVYRSVTYVGPAPWRPVGVTVATSPPLTAYRFLTTHRAQAVKIPGASLRLAMDRVPAFRLHATRRAGLRAAGVLKQTGLRHEQITQQVFVGSTGRYIPGPYASKRADICAIPVVLDPGELQAFAPPGLDLGRLPLMGMYLYSELGQFDHELIPASREIRYDETALAVFVQPGLGLPRTWFPWIAPGNLMAQTVGREVYGYAKVLQGVDIRRDRVRVRANNHPVHRFDPRPPRWDPAGRWLNLVLGRLPRFPLTGVGGLFRALAPRASGRRPNVVPGLPITILGWHRVRNPQASQGGAYDPSHYARDALMEHLIDLQGVEILRHFRVPNQLDIQPHPGGPRLTVRSTPVGAVRFRARLSLLPVKAPVVTDFLDPAVRSGLSSADLAKLSP